MVRSGAVLATFTSVVAAGTALAGREPHPLVVGIQAAPPLGIALGAVGAAAFRSKGWWVVGVASGAAWVAVGAVARRSFPASKTPHAAGIRVLSANVLKWNRSYDEVARTLDARDADVMITIETSQQWRTELASRMRAVPIVSAAGGSSDETSVVIWSERTPEASGTIRCGDGDFPWARFATTGGSLLIVGVHVQSPAQRGQFGRWKAQLAALRAWSASRTEPFVLAGDFNAALTNPSLHALVGHVDDAARAAGARCTATYPSITYPLGRLRLPIRLMTLDHIFVGGTARSTQFDRGRLPGSDHDLVWADVEVSASRPVGADTDPTTSASRASAVSAINSPSGTAISDGVPSAANAHVGTGTSASG